MIDEIIEGLLGQKKEKVLTPEEEAKKNTQDLKIVSELGRSAIELENSKAFQDLILPHAKSVLENTIKELIIKGLTLTNDEKNTFIVQMQSALNVQAIIKDRKMQAEIANKELSRRERILKKKEIKLTEIRKGEEARMKVIKRKERKLERGGEK